MSDLVEFLLARLAEDEAAVGDPWRWEHDEDRERLRREVKAKRRIADAYVDAHGRNRDTRWGRGMRLGTHLALDAIASVYADHADYREEWLP